MPQLATDVIVRTLSVEFENLLLRRTTPHRSKRLPMQRGGTVLFESGKMLRRAVTLVRSQAVLGEDRVPLAHHAVAFDFGQNRSRRNRGRKCIPMDDRQLRQF